MKEYVLGLAEVCKIMNEKDLDEVKRDNFMEEKVQTFDSIDEQRNEKEKSAKCLRNICAKRSAAVNRGK